MRFFVLKHDGSDDHSSSEGCLLEIQILDESGRAKSIFRAKIEGTKIKIVSYSKFAPDDGVCGKWINRLSPQILEREGIRIPAAVLAAAARQVAGNGDYVNERGESISPSKPMISVPDQGQLWHHKSIDL
jgi:hypothetical protein